MLACFTTSTDNVRYKNFLDNNKISILTTTRFRSSFGLLQYIFWVEINKNIWRKNLSKNCQISLSIKTFFTCAFLCFLSQKWKNFLLVFIRLWKTGCFCLEYELFFCVWYDCNFTCLVKQITAAAFFATKSKLDKTDDKNFCLII